MAQQRTLGFRRNGSAEVLAFPTPSRPDLFQPSFGFGEGFWGLSRARRLSLLQAGVGLCLADVLASLLAGSVAVAVLPDATAYLDAFDAVLFGTVPALTACVFYERGLYSSAAILRSPGLRQVALAWLHAAGLLLLAGAAWHALQCWWHGEAAIRPVLAGPGVSWASAFIAVGVFGSMAARTLWSTVRKRLIGRVLVHGRAVVVGTGPDAEHVINRLRDDPASGLEVVGVLHDGPERDHASLCGVAVVGGMQDMARAVARSGADPVIVAMPWGARERIAAALAEAERLPVETRLAPDAAAQAYLHYPASLVAGQMLLNVRHPPISGAKAVVKRAEDLVLASVLLLVLAPVLLAVAAAVKLDSRGPVIFRQPRHGFNNRVFSLYKFRTMHADTTDEACVQQTSRNDRRITRMGAFLRRHSLDELPQLLNVLRGEMSIVGPRPHALSTRTEGLLLADALDSYVGRFRVKPGITGWAQVKGWRGELDTREKLERRVEFDLDNVERWSLLLDLRIIWLTLRCVVRDNHAY